MRRTNWEIIGIFEGLSQSVLHHGWSAGRVMHYGPRQLAALVEKIFTEKLLT